MNKFFCFIGLLACLSACAKTIDTQSSMRPVNFDPLIEIEQHYDALSSPVIHWNKLKVKAVLSCIEAGYESAEPVTTSRRTCSSRRADAICLQWRVKATYQCVS